MRHTPVQNCHLDSSRHHVTEAEPRTMGKWESILLEDVHPHTDAHVQPLTSSSTLSSCIGFSPTCGKGFTTQTL